MADALSQLAQLFGLGPADDTSLAMGVDPSTGNPLTRIAGDIGKKVLNTAMVPGQAYNSPTPVTTEQMVKPAADLAGMTTLGAGAIPAEANALRAGIKAYHGSPLERITGAALKHDDQVFTGVNHGEAYENAVQQLGFDPFNAATPVQGANTAERRGLNGFVTNTGRFVDREEAGKIAEAAAQADNAGPLLAHDLKPSIRAYHGSPHDFDAFDLSKIGTGEGAQAYGHGLYFAEAEPVAKMYRDQLQWKGANFDDPQVLAQNALDRNGGDRSAAATGLQNSIDSIVKFHRGKVPAPQAAANAQTQQAIDLLRGSDPITGKPVTPGKMYEVNINADPEHFLDWDKPLSEQHPVVQDAFGKIVDRNIAEEPGWAKLTGREALGAAAERAGQRGAGEASLNQAGIPGIKYLDQGSRGAGEGSRNYVVFDHNIVNIVKKYGLAGLSMLPPAIGAELSNQVKEVDHDPFEGAAKGADGKWRKLQPVDHDPFN